MAVPGVLALALLVVVPLLDNATEDRRLDRIRADRTAFYEAGFVPCVEYFRQPEVEPLAPLGDEVAIDVFPSFSTPHGIRVSADSIRAYRGDPGFHPTPPPLPPGFAPGDSWDGTADAAPTIERFAPVAINPALGSHLLRLLTTEIDEAHAPRSSGSDGTSYLLRYGTSCATAWSPADRSRAGKVAVLAERLIELGQAGESETVGVRTEIRNLLIELEADRLLLDR